jgi:hypothetical protein
MQSMFVAGAGKVGRNWFVGQFSSWAWSIGRWANRMTMNQSRI